MNIVDKSINKGTNIHTLLNIKEISIFDSDLIGVDYIDSGPIFSAFNLLGESIWRRKFYFYQYYVYYL